MKWILALPLALVPAMAVAQERDYCPERPGLDTPPCIIDKGHVSIETALADWTRDDQPDSRTDTVLVGDTKLRVGVTDTLEAQVGWTPYGHVRERDKTTGMVDTKARVGDVSLGAKLSLADPAGDKASVAVLPFVTLPVGRQPVGAGDWGGGVKLPLNFALSDAVALEATPEVDAAVNESGHGRHVAYGSAAGLGFKLTKALTLSAEAQVQQDNDPSGHATPVLAALSLAWQPGKNLQFDVGGAAGLNHDAPDAEVYAGISRRF